MNRTLTIALSAIALAAGGYALTSAGPGQAATSIPASTTKSAPATGSQVAVLAGGCFWGIEAVFENVKGVSSVSSGYAGGSKATADYESVSGKKTGHAEAVRIVFDPDIVSYETLLRIFFSVAHDPTQVNGQHPDYGPNYRSAIFPQNVDQRKVASAYLAQLAKTKSFSKPIATRIESGSFFPAEAYHQDFLRKNPRHPYIVQWDMPKIKALKAHYPQLAR